jgi:hypothetical protein
MADKEQTKELNLGEDDDVVVEDETGEPEPEEAGCEPDAEPTASNPGKPGQKKTATKPNAPPATAKPGSATFTYPFHIRYASEILWDLTGFVDGQVYTADQIKDLLVQNSYIEFAETQIVFHRNAAKNELVITIKGSVKGGTQKRVTHLMLMQAQAIFETTYLCQGSEERVLIYQNDAGAQFLIVPPSFRQATRVRCDLPLTFYINGEEWDLVADLHSHHIMGTYWSKTDDANERLRGITFGVCSWLDTDDRWAFRRFTGQGFETLTRDDVIADE